jgi:hypothetical protein
LDAAGVIGCHLESLDDAQLAGELPRLVCGRPVAADIMKAVALQAAQKAGQLAE